MQPPVAGEQLSTVQRLLSLQFVEQPPPVVVDTPLELDPVVVVVKQLGIVV